MDKSDGAGGKHNNAGVKKSSTSEEGGKTHKELLDRTFRLRCYY